MIAMSFLAIPDLQVLIISMQDNGLASNLVKMENWTLIFLFVQSHSQFFLQHPTHYRVLVMCPYVKQMLNHLITAVCARNLKWELLNGKLLSTLFCTEQSSYHDFLDSTMNVGYVGGT